MNDFDIRDCVLAIRRGDADEAIMLLERIVEENLYSDEAIEHIEIAKREIIR